MSRFLTKEKNWIFCALEPFLNFFIQAIFGLISSIEKKIAYMKKFKKRSRAQKIQFFSFVKKRDIVPSENAFITFWYKKKWFFDHFEL